MTNEDLVFLEELIHTLSDTLQDKSDSYEIINIKNDNSKRSLSREEYLEYTITEVIDDLKVRFHQIE